tara:strand:- start:687 stop:1463 length:777 start_codon:yes stop_codon:yes gene_type:complete
MLTLYRNKKKEKEKFTDFNHIFKDNPSKLIISTPGGLFGFYFMGVSSFLKDNYDLSNYIFSGASAGAWNSLFLSLKADDKPFIDEMLKTDIKNTKSILKLEKKMKSLILKNYNESDFDLDKLYLGVTVLQRTQIKLCVYSDFTSLEDAVNCCIASSHIPFVTGGPFHLYRNRLSFDGGFFSYPYINITTPSLIIEQGIWDKPKEQDTNTNMTVISCSMESLFNLNNINFTLSELYYAGYNDSKKNKMTLDKIFLQNEI